MSYDDLLYAHDQRLGVGGLAVWGRLRPGLRSNGMEEGGMSACSQEALTVIYWTGIAMGFGGGIGMCICWSIWKTKK